MIMVGCDSEVLPLPSQRPLFNIPHEVAYLNCAFMSPLPKVAIAAGEQGLQRKAHPWTIESCDFFSDSETIRGIFARVINASAEDIALIPAVSYGMAQAAHNIPLHREQKILTLAEEFPSNIYPWLDLAQRTGARVVSVPRPDDDDWTSALLARMDDSVAIVAAPHCHWTDGGLIDLEAVGTACRKRGSVLCRWESIGWGVAL
jgi:selenocysteine lyase/cysteine desulfurase